MRAFAYGLAVVTLTTSAVVATSLGCSATNGSQFNSGVGGAGGILGGSGAGAGSGSGMGGVNLSGTGSGTGGSTGSGGPSSDCTVAATLVYVLSEDNHLYSFAPDKKQFQMIGALGCNTAMTPNSMAVDRNAVAWVNYVGSDPLAGTNAGALFKVSTKDASCLGMVANLTNGWYQLGMGYSSNAATGSAETLYLAATGGTGSSLGLGKFDVGSASVAPIGSFSGALNGKDGELTGTGDGRLFGFFTASPVQVAEIDKATGHIKSTKAITGVNTPNAWAFSFWGGDFYLYTADVGNTTVTRYRPSDGTVALDYVADVGFRIVGAGVSTCAPLVQPK